MNNEQVLKIIQKPVEIIESYPNVLSSTDQELEKLKQEDNNELIDTPKAQAEKLPNKEEKNETDYKITQFPSDNELEVLAEEMAIEENVAPDFELPDLPSFYNEDTLVLLPVDPYRYFSYWEVSQKMQEITKGQEQTLWVMRFYLAQDKDIVTSSPFYSLEILEWSYVGSMYINFPNPPPSFFCEIGFVANNGNYQNLLRSNVHETFDLTVMENIEEDFTVPTPSLLEEMIEADTLKLCSKENNVSPSFSLEEMIESDTIKIGKREDCFASALDNEIFPPLPLVISLENIFLSENIEQKSIIEQNSNKEKNIVPAFDGEVKIAEAKVTFYEHLKSIDDKVDIVVAFSKEKRKIQERPEKSHVFFKDDIIKSPTKEGQHKEEKTEKEEKIKLCSSFIF